MNVHEAAAKYQSLVMQIASVTSRSIVEVQLRLQHESPTSPLDPIAYAEKVYAAACASANPASEGE